MPAWNRPLFDSLCQTTFTPEQRNDLMERYLRTRSIEDRNAVVMAHDRLLGYMATRWMRLHGDIPGVTWEELRSDGALGLIRAVERYNPAFNAKFTTYACQWIYGGIAREHYRRRLMRGIPAGARKPKQISLDMMRATYKLELATVRAVNHQTRLADAIAEALKVLTPRYREILKRLYIDKEKCPEIAASIGVTHQRISQIHARALEQLRDVLKPLLAATSG